VTYYLQKIGKPVPEPTKRETPAAKTAAPSTGAIQAPAPPQVKTNGTTPAATPEAAKPASPQPGGAAAKGEKVVPRAAPAKATTPK
jgi:hypothetical protein